MRTDAADCLSVTLEHGDHFFAGDVYHLNRAVVAGGEQFAIVVEEGQLPDQLEVRFQGSYLVLISANVCHVEVAIIIARCHEITAVRPGEGSQEDLTQFQLLDSLFGGSVEEVDAAEVSGCDDIFIQKLQFPVLHDCALED